MKNPCIGCGACCSYFRVSFYQGEMISVGGFVPDDNVVRINDFFVAMKGTETKDDKRCIKLSGTVGECASCSMYDQRPTPCRDFPASYENGSNVPDERCDKARISHGLDILSISDWM